MQGEILAYMEKRKIPLKTKHIANKFHTDIQEITIILNILSQQYFIKYQLAQRQDRVDWAGWIVCQERNYLLESLYYDSLA